MTNKDFKIRELEYLVSDKIKTIQLLSASMKNPEDKNVILSIVRKIQDNLGDIESLYYNIELLEINDEEE